MFRRFSSVLMVTAVLTLASNSHGVLVQAVDLNLAGTVNSPTLSGFTAFNGSVTTNPAQVGTDTVGGVTWSLFSGTGNTGWRDRGAIAGVAKSDLLRDLFFNAGGLRLSFNGLTPGTTYSVNIYGYDATGNDGLSEWYFSTTGVTSGTGAGTPAIGDLAELATNPLPAGFLPTPQTGTTTATAGQAMITQTFVAPASGIANFFTTSFITGVLPAGSLKGDAHVINGWELSTVAVTAAAIPEPASVSMLLVAGIALVRRRRMA